MKKLLLFISMLMGSAALFAQFPVGANNKTGQAPPSIGHVYGKVVDSTGKAIADASVVVLQNRFDSVSKKKKDVLLKGVSTNHLGEFSVSELPMFGGLKLKISASGYKAYEQAVSFQFKMDAGASSQRPNSDPSQAMSNMSNMLNSFDKDLGNIKLAVDVQQLQT